jgi:hypothetical protein
MPSKTDKDGALRCTKCDRLMKLESEFYGFTRTPNGPPDWPVHVWNGWVTCDKAPATPKEESLHTAAKKQNLKLKTTIGKDSHGIGYVIVQAQPKQEKQ